MLQKWPSKPNIVVPLVVCYRSNSDPHTLGRTSHLPVASECEDKPKSGNSPAAPLLVM